MLASSIYLIIQCNLSEPSLCLVCLCEGIPPDTLYDNSPQHNLLFSAYNTVKNSYEMLVGGIEDVSCVLELCFSSCMCLHTSVVLATIFNSALFLPMRINPLHNLHIFFCDNFPSYNLLLPPYDNFPSTIFYYPPMIIFLHTIFYCLL